MNRFLIGMAALLMVTAGHAEDITIRFDGTTAQVKQEVKDSVNVTVEGAHVSINSTYQAHKLTVRLKGQSDDGQLILKTAGKAQVKLDGLNLTSQEGAPLWLKNQKKVEIKAVNGTKNKLTITACNDTANHKAATIWAKGKLLFSGKGTLDVEATGDGCRGIKAKKDITIEELTLNVFTKGNHLGEKPFGMGGFGGGPMGGMPQFNPDDLPEEVKKQFEEKHKEMEEMMKNGEFPMGGFGGPFGGMRPERNDSTRQGGFPGHAEGGFPAFGNHEDGEGSPMGGFGGKHTYIAATKGIASKGKIIINSGDVFVRTITAGAEGIEGKEGVILNGGRVFSWAVDDAINANAAIEFNGANVVAQSTANDAVDANLGGFFMPFGMGNQNQEKEQEPAIIITAGTVYAWSEIGAPEEGLDCDFSPIEISGGNVFSVGAGIGDMPSVPTNSTAKQPTVLLVGIDIFENQPIQLYDSKGKLLDTITVPFSLQRSSSLLSNEHFQMGETYTVKTTHYEKAEEKTYEKTFTLNENFTIVR